MPQGVVKWFSPKAGYGFITSEGIPNDIMVHFNDIKMDGYKKLIKGQTVNYEYKYTDRGPKAANIEIVRTKTKKVNNG